MRRFGSLLVLLHVVLSGCGGQVGETDSADLRVTMSADALSATPKFTFTITNQTAATQQVLSFETPLDGIEADIFQVERDGVPVAYTGIIVKRAEISAEDYLAIAAGQSLSASVDLSSSYDMSKPGVYSVKYRPRRIAMTAEQLKIVPTVSSNVTRQWFQGVEVPQVQRQPLVAGSTSFTNCSAEQQAELITARNEASTYATNASAYLQAGTQGPRYTTWFGIYDANRYAKVNSNFTAIRSAMDNAGVVIDCKCKKKYIYASVNPGNPYVISVCGAFWRAPMTGTDSKAGTLIHEMSHFYVVADTDDVVYGQTGAQNLAISDPALAITNADSHEYFAENNPFQN